MSTRRLSCGVITALVMTISACTTLPPSSLPGAGSPTEALPHPLARSLEQINIEHGREKNLFVVTLFDKSGLSLNGVGGEARQALQYIADYLTQFPADGARIAGHSTGDQRASERKAQAVADVLISFGVNPGRLQIIGYGGRYPLDLNDTPWGKEQNQRVEIEIGRMK